MNPQVITVAGESTVHITGDKTLQVVTIPESVKIITVGIQGPAGAPGAASADKFFAQAFNTAPSVTVTHNLAKFPAVSIVDSAGDEVDGDVLYLDQNTVQVVFSAAFSGMIYCN